MTYELHPACAAWPQMTDTELDELAANIKAVGLLEPITLTPDGKLLDGRNRMLACERAGSPPATVVYNGDPVLYSLGKNKQRRHMSVDQIALVAATLVTTEHGGARNFKSSNEPLKPTTIADAAKTVGVPETAIKSARTVLSDGSADEINAVRTGAAKLRATADTVRQRNKPAAPPRPPSTHTASPAANASATPDDAASAQPEPRKTYIVDGDDMWSTPMPGDELVALIAEHHELQAQLANLEADHQDLIDILTMHGLDWYAPMPAVRITDSDRAAKWWEHAQAYNAEWERLRVHGGTEGEWKRVHDDFYDRYREQRAAEALVAVGASLPKE